ncbi:MAG: hypothetical protein KDD06_29250 [Phaeodactylibacter sp.]|nr:hypothetical protein [Phaeodactylibacter sp.]MCB9286561.1 hypothetical protein [Lewinellaceae bacterium]
MVKITLYPQKLFLIDGLGALLSAVLLGVVLVQWEHAFGMPRQALYPLAAIAGLFAVYSLSCYWRLSENRRPYLRVIAVANLLYCCLSLALVVYFYSQLTVLGVAYFLVEIAVVLILAGLEYNLEQIRAEINARNNSG